MSGEASDNSSLQNAGQSERASRTNLLLSGTIQAADIKGPVRIRNLSATGALLEGPALPAVGEHLVLRRLHMEMGATVMWLEKARCGISFDGVISVAGWREGNWIAPAVTSDQARIDSIQAAVRAGVPPASVDAPAPRHRLPDRDADVRIAEELIALRQLLGQTGEALSEEPAVVQRYQKTFQNFDIACQILGHLATVLAAEDRPAAIDRVGMDDLRRRLGGNLQPRG